MVCTEESFQYLGSRPGLAVEVLGLYPLGAPASRFGRSETSANE